MACAIAAATSDQPPLGLDDLEQTATCFVVNVTCVKVAHLYAGIEAGRYPIRSIVIRDDAPETQQRWRVFFANDEESTFADLDQEYRTRQHYEDHETRIAP